MSQQSPAPPVITAPASAALPRFVSVAFAGTISVDDPFGVACAGTMHLTVACEQGRLHANSHGAPLAGAGTGKLEANLPLADLNAALRTLAYSAPTGTEDEITITVFNQAGLSASKCCPVRARPVSPPPPPPPAGAGIRAARATDLTGLFAVNTHLDFGAWGLTPAYAD